MKSVTSEDSPFIEFVVSQDNMGARLDAYVANLLESVLPGSSRNYVQKLIENDCVSVQGLDSNRVKSNYKVKKDDIITVFIPENEELNVEAEDIPLDIVYEDDDIIIINKARGMVVHPAEGNFTGTLVNALLFRCKDLSDINGVKRPGIVHRIDKDTTGLLVVAKNNFAHNFLSQQLKKHEIERTYIALVEGAIKEQFGNINAPIGRHPVDRKKMAVNLNNGKPAVTHFEVLSRVGNYTLVKCMLETGRTHQIRVHMSYIGFPVVGDPVYGRNDNRGISGQALHAYRLMLVHPTSKEKMTFYAPLPEDFQALLKRQGLDFESFK